MNRIRAWGLSAALAVGTAVPTALAADLPDRPTETKPTGGTSYISRLFKPAEKPSEPPKTANTPAAPQPLIAGPLAPETLAEALRAEQDAYLRRLDVCTKLRVIASETNDDALFEQANTLEQQATALYHARVARYGVRGGPKYSHRSPTPLTSITTPAEASRSPEAVLDAKLGTGVSTNPLNATKPTPTTVPATANAQRFREVQP